MGGRIASHVAADGASVDGLLFLGFPLHPAGRPGTERAAHLSRIAVPMLFVQGTKDALADPALLAAVLRDLSARHAARDRRGRPQLPDRRAGAVATTHRCARRSLAVVTAWLDNLSD